MTQGGLISGNDDAVLLNGDSSTVTIVGRTVFLGTGPMGSGTIEGENNPNNTLNFDLITSPGKAAGLKAYIANGHTASGYYNISQGYTYAWDGFGGAGSSVNVNALSLELNVDSGLVAAAVAVDTFGLPAYTGPNSPGAQADIFYAAAYGNPEAAMNELVGREITEGLNTIGLNIATTLDSDLHQHLDNLLTGNQLGGIDLGGLHVSDAGSMYAMGDTTSELNSILHMTGDTALRGTEMSTDTKEVVTTAQPKWGVWASGNVTLGNDSGISTFSGFHSTLGSPTFGFDYKVTPNLVLGLLASYTTGDANFGDGSKINSNVEIGALYGAWRDGNWHVDGVAGAGTSQFTDTRTTFGGLVANSTPRGDDVITDATAGYDFHFPGLWTITPELGLQYTHLDINGFTESGAGLFDLSEGSQEVDSLRSHVGFVVNKGYHLGKDLTLSQEVRALWYHEFMDNNVGVSTSLPGAPALGSFTVTSFAPQRDFALVGTGINVGFTGYHGMPVGMFLNYNAQVGQSDYISHSVNTGIRVDF